MSEFRVWAPLKKRVELSLGAQRIDMKMDERGWWSTEAGDAPPGSDYAYFVDGEGPYPDPRSPWQPAGLHGPSRTVGHAAFRWQHEEWTRTPLAQAVIYELHTGTFTPGGTFDAAIAKLDHLTGLGVTHVEVMPVAHFSGERGWGYDGADLYAPHEAYGGPEGVKRLVDACHGLGLRVLLDVVYNHLGPTGNYLESFAPYFTPHYHTPWGKAVNFDQPYADEVRRFVVDNALMWLRDYRFDGLRLDAVDAILDQSATHVLEQIATETRALERQTGRKYDIIAESDLNDPRLVRDVEIGGYGLDGAWSDDFHHAVHALLTGERTGYYADFGGLSQLKFALERIYVYDGRYSAYRRRTHGRSIGGLPATKFVHAIQNHDQVGNRAKGERLEHIAGPRRARVGAALLLLSPAVPLLFQGEEWAASTPFQYFTDHQEPELARAVSEGRRREFATFGWQPGDVPDPQAIDTFERSRLDWSELSRPPHADMLAWYRDLIALRRTTPELTDGRLQEVRVEADEAADTLTMRRGSIVLAVNLSKDERMVWVAAGTAILLSSDGAGRLDGTRLTLTGDSCAVLKVEE